MKVTASVFGPEVTLKQEITLDRPSLPLEDLLGSLLQREGERWKRILNQDFSIKEGYEVLVNGRNVKSLQGMATEIHEGDEIVFTVMMSGG
jgi:molybdopterin converting factor small subunit